MNTIILNGNLRLHKDKYEFLIDGTNLTKVLEKIYFSDYPALDITVENEARRVFKKYGELMFNKNDNGNWVFHVEDFNLDEILFNQLNKENLYLSFIILWFSVVRLHPTA